MFFLKTAEDWKTALGCNWMSQISENGEKLGFLLEKNWSVFEKKWLFYKSIEVAILHYNATEIVRNLEFFQKLVLYERIDRFFSTKNYWFFFQKILNFKKMLNVVNLP